MDNETIENNKKDIEIFLENQNDVSLLAILKSDTETLANQEVLFNVFDGNNNILIRTISIKSIAENRYSYSYSRGCYSYSHTQARHYWCTCRVRTSFRRGCSNRVASLRLWLA